MNRAWDPGIRRRIPPWLLAAGAAIVAVLALGPLARTGVAPTSELPINTAPRDDDSQTGTVDALTGLCERDQPIAVIDDTAYPPGFPEAPITLPDACYPTVNAARADGFRVASTPQHAELVGGVYLVPITEVSLGHCVRQAAAAEIEIPCLGRQPTQGINTVCAGNCIDDEGGYVRFLRHIPTRRSWCDGCVPKILVAAADVDAAPLVRGLVRCGGPESDRGLNRTFFCDQPLGASMDEIHAGNTMRRGRHEDTYWAVSVSGRGKAQRALVNRLARSLLFVGN